MSRFHNLTFQSYCGSTFLTFVRQTFDQHYLRRQGTFNQGTEGTSMLFYTFFKLEQCYYFPDICGARSSSRPRSRNLFHTGLVNVMNVQRNILIDKACRK
jgi:hypothetical protein